METLKLEITIKMLCTLVQDNFEQISAVCPCKFGNDSRLTGLLKDQFKLQQSLLYAIHAYMSGDADSLSLLDQQIFEFQLDHLLAKHDIKAET
ncbi:MAG: hypothetical protein JKY70_02510 [Mucilaginibacter sp.]|nr:hypothetical protein [Mucilaginibacter sp.]